MDFLVRTKGGSHYLLFPIIYKALSSLVKRTAVVNKACRKCWPLVLRTVTESSLIIYWQWNILFWCAKTSTNIILGEYKIYAWSYIYSCRNVRNSIDESTLYVSLSLHHLANWYNDLCFRLCTDWAFPSRHHRIHSFLWTCKIVAVKGSRSSFLCLELHPVQHIRSYIYCLGIAQSTLRTFTKDPIIGLLWGSAEVERCPIIYFKQEVLPAEWCPLFVVCLCLLKTSNLSWRFYFCIFFHAIDCWIERRLQKQDSIVKMQFFALTIAHLNVLKKSGLLLIFWGLFLYSPTPNKIISYDHIFLPVECHWPAVSQSWLQKRTMQEIAL